MSPCAVKAAISQFNPVAQGVDATAPAALSGVDTGVAPEETRNMPSQPFSGVLVPVLTPFTSDGDPDAARFTAFCRWLLDQGAGGLAIFGTTSEANSMSPAERMELLDRLIEAGIPAQKLMPGTGACAMTDAAILVRHAAGHGISFWARIPASIS